MHTESREYLKAAGYDNGACKWCNCPELEYSGNTESGITRIDCNECGALFSRMTGRTAIAHYSYKLADAADMRMEREAHSAYRSIMALMSNGGMSDSSTALWVMTRAGSEGDDLDSTPF